MICNIPVCVSPVLEAFQEACVLEHHWEGERTSAAGVYLADCFTCSALSRALRMQPLPHSNMQRSLLNSTLRFAILLTASQSSSCSFSASAPVVKAHVGLAVWMRARMFSSRRTCLSSDSSLTSALMDDHIRSHEASGQILNISRRSREIRY